MEHAYILSGSLFPIFTHQVIKRKRRSAVRLHMNVSASTLPLISFSHVHKGAVQQGKPAVK